MIILTVVEAVVVIDCTVVESIFGANVDDIIGPCEVNGNFFVVKSVCSTRDSQALSVLHNSADSISLADASFPVMTKTSRWNLEIKKDITHKEKIFEYALLPP